MAITWYFVIGFCTVARIETYPDLFFCFCFAQLFFLFLSFSLFLCLTFHLLRHIEHENILNVKHWRGNAKCRKYAMSDETWIIFSVSHFILQHWPFGVSFHGSDLATRVMHIDWYAHQSRINRKWFTSNGMEVSTQPKKTIRFWFTAIIT